MEDSSLRALSSDEDLEEIHLPNAPLARVVAQVRYPRLTALAANDDGANAIAFALRNPYPIFHESREAAITITPEGLSQAPGGGRLWQLRTPEQDWQVSFGPEFVAIETSAYTSREDFATRLEAVLECFAEKVAPPFAERIGIRYTNRIENAAIDELKTLVRPEALAGLLVPGSQGTVARSLTHVLYNMHPNATLGDAVTDGLQVYWGLLPPEAVVDPTLAPVSSPSWVLDLDSFRVGKSDIASSVIADDVRNLGKRAYQYFRWVVTADFITRYGGRS
jgi:uncharacterized protein (TIGR04255 family)